MNFKSYQSRSGRFVEGGPCSDCGAVLSSQFRKSARSGSNGAILCNKCGLKEQRRLQKEKLPPSGAPKRQPAIAASRFLEQLCGREVAAPTVSQHNVGKKCFFCHTEESPLWRAIDDKPACNACGLRNKRLRDRLGQARTTLHLWRSSHQAPKPLITLLHKDVVGIAEALPEYRTSNQGHLLVNNALQCTRRTLSTLSPVCPARGLHPECRSHPYMTT